MEPANEIVTFQASQNRGLATTLGNLEGAFLTAAQQNLDTFIATSRGDYTGAERRAMVVCEQLKLVNGMDLAAVLLRGKLVRQIREEGLWTQHPQGYHSLEEMARDAGVAPSELSNSITLCETIFPYLEAHLGISVPVIWEQIGKSNFRELIPTLMGIITGNTPNATVAASVASILGDTAATLRTARQAEGNNTPPTDDELNDAAITTLLEQGSVMTNRELRGTVRPTRTPAVDCTVVNNGGRRTLVASFSDEQWLALQRKVGTFLDAVEVPLPTDPRQRTLAARNVRDLRELVNLITGGTE